MNGTAGGTAPRTSIVLIATLLGSVIVIGGARDASAAGCHVDDRPVFGLTSPTPGLDAEHDRPAEAADVVDDDRAARRALERRCPGEAPGRSTRLGENDRGPSAVGPPVVDPPGLALGAIISARSLGRAVHLADRIDRPPRFA